MAAMPEEQFEAGIAAAKDQIGEVTTAFMLRQAEELRRATSVQLALLGEIELVVHEVAMGMRLRPIA